MSNRFNAIYITLTKGPQIFRFGFVAVIGLGVDIGVAWVLVKSLNRPLFMAAIAGFLCGAVLNYGLHELWTFQNSSKRLSVKRLLKYLLGLWFVLAVRLSGISALSLLFPSHAFPILLVAIALSFCVNYIVSRSLIFR